jgi:hypothetical protein
MRVFRLTRLLLLVAVVGTWKEHAAAPEEAPGRDFVRLNRKAAVTGVTDPKSTAEFRKCVLVAAACCHHWAHVHLRSLLLITPQGQRHPPEQRNAQNRQQRAEGPLCGQNLWQAVWVSLRVVNSVHTNAFCACYWVFRTPCANCSHLPLAHLASLLQRSGADQRHPVQRLPARAPAEPPREAGGHPREAARGGAG